MEASVPMGGRMTGFLHGRRMRPNLPKELCIPQSPSRRPFSLWTARRTHSQWQRNEFFMNSYVELKHYQRQVLFTSLAIGRIATIMLCLAAARVLSPSLFAQGTLAIGNISQGMGGQGVYDTVQLSFGSTQESIDIELIDALVLTTNDVNQLFVITPAQDDNFTAFVSVLTNGLPDSINVNLSGGRGGAGINFHGDNKRHLALKAS
jgi:hypothetical protein